MVLQPPQSRGFLDGGQGDLCPVAHVPVHPELSQSGEAGQGGREGGQLVTLQGEHLARKGNTTEEWQGDKIGVSRQIKAFDK